MHTFLEIKRMAGEWKTVFFQREDLPLCSVSDETAKTLIETICTVMSKIGPNELFNPLEVSNCALSYLDEGDYNDNEWEEINSVMYDLVNDFSTIMLNVMKDYCVINLVYIDEVSIEVQFRTPTKEYF